VTTNKLADNVKLTESERSQALVTQNAGLLNTEVSVGLLGSYSTALSVASTTLPAGQYVVTGEI
jgi:hypothetical protein